MGSSSDYHQASWTAREIQGLATEIANAKLKAVAARMRKGAEVLRSMPSQAEGAMAQTLAGLMVQGQAVSLELLASYLEAEAG